MRILKVIGLLLEYPDELLWENRDDALALVRADVPSLTPFVGELLTAPLLDRQAEWCEVFERGRATSLLLFEHVHAESRDRGQAMVDLMNQYQLAGLQIDCRELPDHLPLYLEYLSILPPAEAREGLQNIAPILALIGGWRWLKARSPVTVSQNRWREKSATIPVRRWTPCGKKSR